MSSSAITNHVPGQALGVSDVAAVWPGSMRRVAAWFAVPPHGVMALILFTLFWRLLFATWFGLGIDESYMVAAGRQLQLSYFDHPPLAWWLAWGAARLFGNEAAITVRLPSILLFALSTWLMYRLGARLLSRQAGLWAAVLLNLVPVLGFTAASWVVPDGPLDCALLGFALSFSHALEAKGWAACRWWLVVGTCAGLAMLAKYSAVLTLAGAGIYLLTQPAHRPWLTHPLPWLAATVALLLFAPVVIWNAEHGWASFAFQSGRAAGHHWHFFAPLVTLAGEALFLMPWIWLPLVWCSGRVAKLGPRYWQGWLLCCLGAPPVLAFTLVSAWAHQHVLYHWAAPGYMMLLPLLGAACAERLARGSQLTRFWLAGSAVILLLGVGVVGSEVRWNWLPETGEDFAPANDPDLAAVDWSSLRSQLNERGLLGPGSPVYAATRWMDAGKLDYALGGAATVICLGEDPREYGIARPIAAYAGRDVVIVAPHDSLAHIRKVFGVQFHSIEALPSLRLLHRDRFSMEVALFLGHGLKPPA